MKSYWVVSPNVRFNKATVSDWRQASILGEAVFMGWGPNHKPLGYKFAHEISPGDIVLIARRHKFNPEIVGFGAVRGQYTRTIKGVKTPEDFGSARRLSPFIAVSEAPTDIDLIDALRHTSALAKLHPNGVSPQYKAHTLVCNWMEKLLKKWRRAIRTKEADESRAEKSVSVKDMHIAAAPANYQLDYTVRSKKQVIRAEKREALLVMDYRLWLKRQGRSLLTTKIGKLQCDGYEEKRRNLIEAKSSISREHLRMAVGQLLDYGFEVERKYGQPNMGILLPREPERFSVSWLQQLNISLIWREKGAFLDNANGQFT